MSLRYLTAGESHGQALTAILDGMPAGLRISADRINYELARRQKGYGRGKRMSIEKDQVNVLSGIRLGMTLGSPICLLIANKDWDNWKEIMSPFGKSTDTEKRITRPRPGHADLSGYLKYRHNDIRNVIERASARETAAKVSIGAICKIFIEEFNIKIISHVIQIGDIRADNIPSDTIKIQENAEGSPVRCADKNAEDKMIKKIDETKALGDSLGGIFEILAINVPVGLGSYVSSDRRLDGRIAQAIMSIPAIKGVQIGMGFRSASLTGSNVHDEIFYESGKGYYRKTNRAGGIEGGMSNGEIISIQAAMKPIPTLYKPLKSVDIQTKEAFEASVERSDICAVPAASIIGEAVIAIEIARTFLERYGGDSIDQIKDSWREDQTFG